MSAPQTHVMARRLSAALRLDVMLQARSQLYAIGVAMAIAFGLMVRFLIPQAHIGRGLVAFYILGLSGTTFMFGASMLLLEKGERTLQALQTTMITTNAYIVSKAMTLTGFTLIESGIIYLIAAWGVPTRFGPLLLGVVVLGIFNTFLGLGVSAAYKAVTRFLFPTGALVGMILQLPFLSLLGVEPAWLWYLIPTQAPLLILQAAFEPIQSWQWGYALAVSMAMIGGAWGFCRLRFRQWIHFPE